MRLLSFAAPLALIAAPVGAQDALKDEVTSILDEAGPATSWGLMVTDGQGREVLSIDPDKRFVPASNTKIFTTAAAMDAVAQGQLPEAAGTGARVRISRTGKAQDVILEGRGDPHLSAAPDCATDCLATLADAVAKRTRRVRNVVGDAAAFPDQRWSPGMSWNNIPTRSGTGISALSIDDNEILASVAPGKLGELPAVTLPSYYSLMNLATTVPGNKVELGYDRAPNGRELVLTGSIGVDAKPETLRLGVDDPAHYAAWRLAEMLRVRGVRVTGEVSSRYRPLLPSDDPAVRGDAPPVRVPAVAALAQVETPPIGETVRTVNKVSQNLYAELLLRRTGCIRGTCSIADGQAAVTGMLVRAGVPEGTVSLSDGSGMSTYNRVTPRATVRLLDWVAGQAWGAEFRASLPVGGVDGTLSRRFAGTALAERIFAKTGTLNATNALAGYMTGASGRALTFAIYANDVPEAVRATQFMDRALLAIAAAN
ncbi:D-alanyl-D-alanine carboxypeptidase precursor [Tsuneonella dongtanensis]|uniref:D-alanyl-D-alanine carboxypeptidase n=1 Tax=Tsuneonella dongtanensis TaxID=692370 RepID=A0A1B2AFM8_9SPHN|nr:D-alanyl-D-alanine carboxypeptidase/D-alanyl-D-alanine-endopeptidase [Tsuneonella dongtanensis]ANY20957.1 D-alanyl-D-alanine carboxypeptidase precursor [Tsuneonella dongtanensis]